MQSRRGFLRGAAAFLAAPAIVRASSLMAISPLPLLQQEWGSVIAINWPPFKIVHGWDHREIQNWIADNVLPLARQRLVSALLAEPPVIGGA